MKKLLLTTALLLIPIGIAFAADKPEMKEGLWSIHTQSVDNPGNKKTESSSTICRSHAYDQYVESHASPKGCTTVKESFEAGKHVHELHCVIGSMVIDSQGTTTFQGDTSAHSETHATYSPAMAGVSESSTIMDSKYTGSCPAGVQPGDLTDAHGNVNQLWKH